MDEKLLKGLKHAVLEDLTAEVELEESANEASLGRLAVSMGCLSEEQLAACLAEQEEAASGGRGPTLWQVMLRRRLLSAGDLMWILCRHREKHGLKSEMIGRYLILGELGRGAGGVVYRALHKDLDKEIALKVMVEHAELPASILERFRREARIAAGLRHPNMVQVHDVGSEGSRHYIAMDLIEGPTLARWLAEPGGRPLPSKLAILSKVARALDDAHRKGVVHRDLKPANILLDAQDEPYVTDFGLARSLGEPIGMTQSGSVFGTPAYMAPEQVRGETRKIDGRTDVYALGVILYEMLSGTLPFRGGTAAEVYDQVLRLETTPPSRCQRGLPRNLEVICLKAMEKEPHRRYPSAAAFADDLDHFLKGEPIVARPPSVVEKVRRTLRRRARALLAAAALAAVAASAAAFLLRPRAPQAAAEPVPADAGAYCRRAAIRKENGDLRGALDDYNAAIRMRPDSAPPYYYRAFLHQAMGNRDRMLADLDKVIELNKGRAQWDPHVNASYLMRANHRYRAGAFSLAVEDLTQVLRWRPDNVEALSTRGLCYRALKRYPDCVKDLDLAVRLRSSVSDEVREALAEARRLAPIEGVFSLDYSSGPARTATVEATLTRATAAAPAAGVDGGAVLGEAGSSALTVRLNLPVQPIEASLELDHFSSLQAEYGRAGSSRINVIVNGELAMAQWEICHHSPTEPDRLRITSLLREGSNAIEILYLGGRAAYRLRRLEVRCLFPPGISCPRQEPK